MDPAAIYDLISQHKWPAVSAILIGLIVRLLKSDTPIPVDIPPRLRAPLALWLGVLSGILEWIAAGTPAGEAIGKGLVAGLVAVLGHVYIVDVARGGRDIGVAKPKKAKSAPPKAATLCLALALVVGLPACASVLSAIAIVAPYVAEGTSVLIAIQRIVDVFFRQNPNPEKEKHLALVINKCFTALVGAEKLLAGVDDLNQAKIDEAFKDFKVAYTELLALTGPMGVTSHSGAMRAAPGGLTVPHPDALIPKVRR